MGELGISTVNDGHDLSIQTFSNSFTDIYPYSHDMGTLSTPDPLYPPPDYEVGSEYHQPARIRNTMINSAFDCPGKLCDAGYSLVASMPRLKGSSEIPQSVKDQDWSHSDTRDYAIGLLSFSFIFPFVFFLISACTGLWFCILRGCCNTCGQRVATKKYDTCQVVTVILGLVIWFVLVALVAFLTIATNHGISRGLNDTVHGTDGVFTFVDQAVITLSSTTEPFGSRVIQLNHVIDALQRLPTQSQIDTMDNCYQTHAVAMGTHIALSKQFITQRNNLLDLDGFAELSDALTPINDHLEQFDTLETTHPRDEWQPTASRINSLGTIDYSLPTADVSQVFTTASTTHHHLSRVDVSLSHATSPNQDQINLFPRPRQALTLIGSIIYTEPMAEYFQERRLTASQCQAIQPSLSALHQDLSQFVQLENAVGGLTNLLQLTAGKARDLTQQWTFIHHHLAAVIANITPLLQQYDTFLDLPSISGLRSVPYDDLSKTQHLISLTDGFVQSIRSAIEQYDGTPAEQQDFDVTKVEADMVSVGTSIPPTTSAVWGTIHTQSNTIPFLNNCIGTIANTLQTGDQWVAIVPDEIRFFPEHAAMLKARSEDTDGYATQVRQNIANAAGRVAAGIGQLASAANALRSIALQLSNDGNPYSDNVLERLNTSLSTILAVFDDIKFDHIEALSAERQQLIDLQVLQSHVESIQAALSIIAGLNSYTTASTEIRRVLRGRLVVFISAALSEMGDCNNDITFSSVVDTNNIQSALSSIYDLRQSSPNQNTFNQHITQLTGVDAHYNALSASNANIKTVLDALSPYPHPDSLVPPVFADLDLTDLTPPTVQTNAAHFRAEVTSLEPHGGYVTDHLLPFVDSVEKDIDDIFTLNLHTQYGPAPTALHLITSGEVLPSDPSLHLPQFPFSPFLSKSSPGEFNQQTYYITRGYLEVLRRAREYQGDAIDVRNDVSSRIQSLDDAVDKVHEFLEEYFDLRTTVKRDGYLIDEQRLIIMDVLISIVLVFAFAMVIFAIFKLHKIPMLCVMLFSPLCTLFFLLACIHLTPSLLLTDVCKDPHGLIQSFVGGAEVNSSVLNGFVTFLGETPEPVYTNDLYTYFTQCPPDQPVPQFLRVLRDANPESAGVLVDELAELRQSLNEMMATYSLTMAPELSNTFDSLLGVSSDLVAKAHQIYDSIQCSKTEGVVQGVIDDSLCASFAQSMTLCGCLCFLLSLCMCPGMFFGIRAFKRLNRRNAVGYTRVVRKGEDGTTFAHESAGGDDPGEIVHYKHQELGFEDDNIDYGQLKGFNQNNAPPQPYHPSPNQYEMEMGRY